MARPSPVPTPATGTAPSSLARPGAAGPSPAGAVDLRGGTVPGPAGPKPGDVPGGSAAPLKLDLPSSRGTGAGLPPNPGARGALNLLPPPPERRTKLSEDIEKSGKPDCRSAHADKGLLGVVPLATAALGGDGGCRW